MKYYLSHFLENPNKNNIRNIQYLQHLDESFSSFYVMLFALSLFFFKLDKIQMWMLVLAKR